MVECSILLWIQSLTDPKLIKNRDRSTSATAEATRILHPNIEKEATTFFATHNLNLYRKQHKLLNPKNKLNPKPSKKNEPDPINKMKPQTNRACKSETL